MRTTHWLVFCGLASLSVLGAFVCLRRDHAAARGRAPSAASSHADEGALLEDLARTIERTPRSEPPATIVTTETTIAPATPAELRALVARLRGLPHDELLRLTNAEYGFQASALIQMLQRLDHEWVVTELAELATAEADPLVKATLLVGLFGGALPSRRTDPAMLRALEEILPQIAMRADDPYRVATAAVGAAFAACLVQKQDAAKLLVPELARSDNDALLLHGLDLLGQVGGADALLADFVKSHPMSEGRLGALEGLRAAGRHARLAPEEIARIGIDALTAETSNGNRVLLIEMIGAVGGEAGLAALEELLRSGKPGDTAAAAGVLAAKADPARALDALSDALRDPDLSNDDRGALYRALGAIEGPETRARLLDVARDVTRSDSERLQGLKGLWHRPMDDELAVELGSIVESDAPAAMRAESLKMLAMAPESAHSIDVKGIAASDRDPAVRREAVLLAALDGGNDARGWLEERLLNDRSPDVKAAALGAMVVQAHYAGDGDGVLAHLERARRMTDDEGVQALLSEGARLVREHDPRKLDLELRKEAEFYDFVSRHTSGAAQRELERQAAYLQRMVAALDSVRAR